MRMLNLWRSVILLWALVACVRQSTGLVVGVEYNRTVKHGTLSPYPSGGGSFMVNFAQHNEGCIQTVLSPFFIYLPFIMLLQVFLLIVTEKISFRIPRLAQNVERFYLNIVEDSLFGKDIDGTEDMRDPRMSTAGIAARRHRNEICVSLKRSSILYNVYLVKKCVHLFLGYIFILLDIGFYFTMHLSEKIPCRIRIPPFPGLLEYSGRIYYEVTVVCTIKITIMLTINGLLVVFCPCFLNKPRFNWIFSFLTVCMVKLTESYLPTNSIVVLWRVALSKTFHLSLCKIQLSIVFSTYML